MGAKFSPTRKGYLLTEYLTSILCVFRMWKNANSTCTI